MASKCQSCGATITWAKTENGRAMPLDAAPVDNGNMQVVDGVAIIVGDLLSPGDDGPRYVSHFATCPNSAAHRRRA